MTLNRTEATQRGIGPRPSDELRVDDLNKFEERREVSVMKPETTKQFPDTFDGVELRAVRRKEQQHKVGILRPTPREMEVGVMVLRIVDDDDDLAAATASGPAQLAQETPTGLSIKTPFGLGGDEPSVGDSDCTKVADAFARRRVAADRIAYLWRDPHAAAAAMLLEMDFIHRPEFDVISSCEAAEFFLLRPAFAGPIEPLPVWVCADGIRVDETIAGTAGRAE